MATENTTEQFNIWTRIIRILEKVCYIYIIIQFLFKMSGDWLCMDLNIFVFFIQTSKQVLTDLQI